MGRLIDLSGHTFGKLKVIKRSENSSYINGEALWVCECSCFKKSVVLAIGSALRQNKKLSCGCIWKPSYEELLIKIKERLVRFSKLNGQCIEWIGFKDKNGYGNICITFDGKEYNWRAHRASWLVHVGKIPNDKIICHVCDNPACIRIDHLYLGTHQDNMNDKMSKGRHIHKKGSETGVAKLDEKKAKEILDMKGGNLTSHEIGNIFNIAASTVRSIWQRINWKHI